MSKSDDERWHELEIAATLSARDDVRRNRTIVLIVALIFVVFAIANFVEHDREGDRLARIEKKIETLTTLTFIQDAERRGIPIDSLICEGELKAIYHKEGR